MDVHFDVMEIRRRFLLAQTGRAEHDLMMQLTEQMGLDQARDILMMSHLCRNNDKALAKLFLKDKRRGTENCSDLIVLGAVLRRISATICEHIIENGG